MKKIEIDRNLKNILNSKKFDVIIMLIYAIITLVITVIFHEKWRDEAQAWLIARDLSPLEIVKQMKYEGHPPLWHFILMPFAKLGFPYMILSIISWFIMCITAWLIIKKSPFNKYTKILILLSAPFIYFYPSISRSYCLIPLAITLIAIYYPDRSEKKIPYVLSVLFLAYTHVNMLGLVGILYLLFFLEQIFYIKKEKKDIKKLIIAFLIAVIGLLCLMLMLLGSVGANDQIYATNELSFKVHNISMLSRVIKLYIKNILAVLNKLEGGMFGAIGYTSGFNTIMFFAIIILCIIETKNNPKNAIILIVSCLWQLFIYVFIYADISEQKANTMFLIFILIAWIGNTQVNKKENFKRKEITFCLFLLIISDIFGLTCMQNEVKYLHSDAKNVANYIEEKLEENSVIITTNSSIASAIIPYTGNKKIWNPSTKQYYTYMVWDEISNANLTMNEIIDNVREEFTSNDTLYLIECYSYGGIFENEDSNVIDLEQKGILSHLLYMSEDENITHIEETYKIYKINL